MSYGILRRVLVPTVSLCHVAAAELKLLISTIDFPFQWEFYRSLPLRMIISGRRWEERLTDGMEDEEEVSVDFLLSCCVCMIYFRLPLLCVSNCQIGTYCGIYLYNKKRPTNSYTKVKLQSLLRCAMLTSALYSVAIESYKLTSTKIYLPVLMRSQLGSMQIISNTCITYIHLSVQPQHSDDGITKINIPGQ